MTKRNRPKRMAVYGLTAGLLGGTLAGAALGVPGLAGAAETATAATAGASGWMTDTLSKLVDDGTITQSQSDAVAKALDEARPQRGPGGPGGPGLRGGMGLDAAAKALGMTAEELRTALAGGQSIAEVAAAKGVAVQTVIAAMVAEHKTHLDEAVAAGKITQTQADERLAEATERVSAMVNGEAPVRGPHGPGPGRGPKPGAPSATPNSFSS